METKTAFKSNGFWGSVIVILTAFIAIIRSWHDGGFHEEELIPALIMLWGGVQALWGRWTAKKSLTLPKLPSNLFIATAFILVAVAGCYTPQVTLTQDENAMIRICAEKSSEFCDPNEAKDWDEICPVIEQQFLVLDTLMESETIKPSARLQIMNVYDVTRVAMIKCDDQDGSPEGAQQFVCENGLFLEELLNWTGE